MARFKVVYVQPRQVNVEARSASEALAAFLKGDVRKRSDKELAEDPIPMRVEDDNGRVWMVNGSGDLLQ